MSPATSNPQNDHGMNRPLGENDIHAFGRPAGAGADVGAPPTPRSRLRWWPGLLAAVLGLTLLLTVLMLVLAVGGVAALADFAQGGGQVWINGRPWDGLDVDAWGWDGMGMGSGLATFVALLVASVLLVLVPLCLVLALLAVAAALGTALLAVLLCVVVAAALVLAPLWLTLMLLAWAWRLLRRSTHPAALAPGPRPGHSLG
jgi:hypothetical protein